MGSGAKAKERQFDISEARVVGPDGDEWKVGDLSKGDRVRVVMAGGGRLVQEVRVLPPLRRKSGPARRPPESRGRARR